ncbi:hypothetical protein GCK72_013315 [Caenorhabditis remanei]|uniref:Uncharacterized protein n=1 Tax=Caenorhabditis remanei TaxID=31234 RepID=A0A6A5GQA9_CAERE|nr:hypothetical protein GCK72_013315 [Caenorhabditis remanei]KAF1756861.1 hypothetical protein GCK72_013315 [Caenorhabditis remanei]
MKFELSVRCMSDCFVVVEIQGIFWGRAIFHLNTTKAKIFWKQYDVSSKRKQNVSVRKKKCHRSHRQNFNKSWSNFLANLHCEVNCWTTSAQYPEEEIEGIELPTTTTRRRNTTTTVPPTATARATITTITRPPPPPPVIPERREEHTGRIGHKNVLKILIPAPLRAKYVSRNTIVETSREKVPEKEEVDEKRLTSAFCARMLENAKNYAVTSKTDITLFPEGNNF